MSIGKEEKKKTRNESPVKNKITVTEGSYDEFINRDKRTIKNNRELLQRAISNLNHESDKKNIVRAIMIKNRNHQPSKIPTKNSPKRLKSKTSTVRFDLFDE